MLLRSVVKGMSDGAEPVNVVNRSVKMEMDKVGKSSELGSDTLEARNRRSLLPVPVTTTLTTLPNFGTAFGGMGNQLTGPVMTSSQGVRPHVEPSNNNMRPQLHQTRMLAGRGASRGAHHQGTTRTVNVRSKEEAQLNEGLTVSDVNKQPRDAEKDVVSTDSAENSKRPKTEETETKGSDQRKWING